MSTVVGILTRGRIDPGTDVATSLLTWGRIQSLVTEVFIGVPVYGSPAPVAFVDGQPTFVGLSGTPVWVLQALGEPCGDNLTGRPSVNPDLNAENVTCVHVGLSGVPVARQVLYASDVRLSLIGEPHER